MKLKASDTLKCPHCKQDPTSHPVTGGELAGEAGQRIAYFCEACDGTMTVKNLGNGEVDVVAVDAP